MNTNEMAGKVKYMPACLCVRACVKGWKAQGMMMMSKDSESRTC